MNTGKKSRDVLPAVFGAKYAVLVLTALFLMLFSLTGMAEEDSGQSASGSGKKITVKLKANGGTVSADKIKVPKNGEFGALPKPVRKGYRFRGWYTKKKGGTRVKASTSVKAAGVKVLYAHWKLRTYTVTYDYNGGSLASGKTNPSTYTITTDTIRLAWPKREGHIFRGWFRDSGYTGSKVRYIRKGSSGDLKLYAKFEPVTYTIQFMKNGVLKKKVKKITAVYDETVRLPDSSEAAFASWNTSADGSGTQYDGGASVKNLAAKKGAVVTLYANPFIVGNNIQKLYDYFQRIGFTKEASAAIVGNLMYESGGGYTDVKLNAVEYSTGRGIGMCQWTDTADMARRTNFEQYCSAKGKPWPNEDLKVQVDFLMEELNGVTYGKVWYFLSSQGYPASYEMSLAKFKKLKDVSLAVGVFCANFERPKPVNANLSQQIGYARFVMGDGGYD